MATEQRDDAHLDEDCVLIRRRPPPRTRHPPRRGSGCDRVASLLARRCLRRDGVDGVTGPCRCRATQSLPVIRSACRQTQKDVFIEHEELTMDLSGLNNNTVDSPRAAVPPHTASQRRGCEKHLVLVFVTASQNVSSVRGASRPGAGGCHARLPVPPCLRAGCRLPEFPPAHGRGPTYPPRVDRPADSRFGFS